MAAAQDASEPEVSVQICTFASKELRWNPDGIAKTQLKLTAAASGARSLLLGTKTIPLADIRTVSQLSPEFVALEVREVGQMGLQCEDALAFEAFMKELNKSKANYERFEQYDQGSVQSYFQYYAKLANQQNMLQDHVRTSTYRSAIMNNPSDFNGAVVMDIGAGSGILSFFSAQAGAKTVYAVEASSAAETVATLAAANKATLNNSDVKVVNKPVEVIGDEVPRKVDVFVSEPIGTFLFNERMIESYLFARDRFLKPGGKMFPNAGNLYVAPFSDAVLHAEQNNKNAFWKNTSFYGLDLSAAVARSTKEHFTQPIVDYINPECLVSEATVVHYDFMTVSVESLKNIEIPFDFEIHGPCLVHGLAGWFDILFEGSDQSVTLSTAPWCPGTHWYQIRFLLQTPLAVNAGQRIEGTLKMEANTMQSYFIRIHMGIRGTDITSSSDMIDLKNPEYRFFTSAATYCPPGTAGLFGQAQQAAQPVGAAWQQAAAAAPAQGQQAQQAQQSGYPAVPPGQHAQPAQGQQGSTTAWPPQDGVWQQATPCVNDSSTAAAR